MNQRGFAQIFSVVFILIILAGLGIFFLRSSISKKETPPTARTSRVSPQTPSASPQNTNEPPLKLKSIGVQFSDFKFTKAKLQFGKPFMEFGFFIPGGDADHPAKNNPQPTFIVPLGTPVRSLVDGIVAATPTVWSGDYSIQITENGKMQKWVYETEHVLNPKVKVGDKVTAGQIVGEVSTFSQAPPGYGTVEIGILKGGNPPYHVCPFAYLDDSIKEETFKNIKALFKSWEEYTGDQTLYDESLLVPGCLTLDPIEG